MDHASNKSAPADAEPGEHVLALVTAHLRSRCRPVVHLLFREAPDSRHPTSFRADATPLRRLASSGAPTTGMGTSHGALPNGVGTDDTRRCPLATVISRGPLKRPLPPLPRGRRAHAQRPEPAPVRAPTSVERRQRRFDGAWRAVGAESDGVSLNAAIRAAQFAPFAES